MQHNWGYGITTAELGKGFCRRIATGDAAAWEFLFGRIDAAIGSTLSLYLRQSDAVAASLVIAKTSKANPSASTAIEIVPLFVQWRRFGGCAVGISVFPFVR